MLQRRWSSCIKPHPYIILSRVTYLRAIVKAWVFSRNAAVPISVPIFYMSISSSSATRFSRITHNIRWTSPEAIEEYQRQQLQERGADLPEIKEQKQHHASHQKIGLAGIRVFDQAHPCDYEQTDSLPNRPGK